MNRKIHYTFNRQEAEDFILETLKLRHPQHGIETEVTLEVVEYNSATAPLGQVEDSLEKLQSFIDNIRQTDHDLVCNVKAIKAATQCSLKQAKDFYNDNKGFFGYQGPTC